MLENLIGFAHPGGAPEDEQDTEASSALLAVMKKIDKQRAE